MKIASGATRIVLIVPNRFVLKIPNLATWKLFLAGLLANLQERTFSKTQWPQLCPVLCSCPLGFWVIMAYARPLTEEEWLAFDYEGFANQPSYTVPVENKKSSFGVLNKQIVAIDYGS